MVTTTSLPRNSPRGSKPATMAPLPTATLLFFFSLLLLVEPASPHGIVGEGLRRVGRHLLQAATPSGSDLALSLCETNICEMQRPDGLCDRWSRSMACPRQEIFRISGDPGSNDKAEMFLNLRSPWGVNCSLVSLSHPTPYTPHPAPHTLHPTPYTLHPTTCTLHPLTRFTPPPAHSCSVLHGGASVSSHAAHRGADRSRVFRQGRCEPAEGAAYDVFVAEGCIPERDYISEMQDTSSRTSKQVKIYLRRNAEFFVSVVRRAGLEGAANCSYGLTSG